MRKQSIVFFLVLSVFNIGYGLPPENLLDPLFGKALLQFFRTEKAENVRDLDSQLTEYRAFLQENGITCYQKTDDFSSDWLFSLKHSELSLEELNSLFMKAKQEQANGVIFNTLKPFGGVAEKYGYVWDEEAEASLRRSATAFCLKNSVTVFRKPENFDIRRSLKKVGNKSSASGVKNIDFIYLINLDKRPEKWKKSVDQLKPYGIIPHRFSAIYGWQLSTQEVNNIALRFMPGMKGERWGSYFCSDGHSLVPKYDFLSEEVYGRPFFVSEMTPGALGCTLSHLSVLQDAYDSGYQTIWILEDDISVQKDPHELTSLIEKLDDEVGESGWDILYTDSDVSEEGGGARDERHDLSHIWRPDASPAVLANLPKREFVGKDFRKVMSRIRTHSMVIRRSGIKKILEHARTNKMFLSYDDEIAFVPNIKLFNLREDYVTFSREGVVSDTQTNEFSESNSWDTYKQGVLEKSRKISGWDFPEKAEKIVNFIYEKKPEVCVEIGAFGGMVTYQIAKTLQFIKKGSIHAIDAWDSQLASEGIKEERNIQFWKSLNMENLYKEFQNMLVTEGIEKQASYVRLDSRKAASQFQDQSIDFLYIDGNSSVEGSFEDVSLYFSKVKEGGYIWLNGARFSAKHQSVAFLMRNCIWLKNESVDDCQSVVFQKKLQEN